jgi:hypothetical protein
VASHVHAVSECVLRKFLLSFRNERYASLMAICGYLNQKCICNVLNRPKFAEDYCSVTVLEALGCLNFLAKTFLSFFGVRTFALLKP